MNIARFSVTRRVTIWMGILAVLVMGSLGLALLNIDLFPDIDFPAIAVITSYPGASPREVEEFVTKPIEEAAAIVSDLEKVGSISRESYSLVIIEFDWGKDMDWAGFDAREKIDPVIAWLPEDAGRPMILKFEAQTFQPVLSVGMSGPRDLRSLYELARDTVKPELEKIPGVAAASIFGGLEREIRVALNWQRLKAYNLGVRQIEGALRSENVNVPSGFVTEGRREFTVRVVGEFDLIEAIGDVVVANRNGAPVYLRDVADVRDTHKDVRSYARINNDAAVTLAVQKESVANTVRVSNAVRKAVAKLPGKLPDDISLSVVNDQAEFIKQAIANLKSVAVEGALLAMIIIFLFLATLRGTFIAGTTIPLAILSTFALMYLNNMTLNMITMGGLVIAIGRMIDDSVVVLENIYRHMELGEPAEEAAVSAVGELATAIMATTFTMLCIFVPLALVGGLVSTFFTPMALVITFGLLASLLAAFTVTPSLSATFLLPAHNDEPPTSGNQEPRLAAGVGYGLLFGVVSWLILWLLAELPPLPALAGGLAFGLILGILIARQHLEAVLGWWQTGIAKLTDRYREAIDWCLHHRAMVVAIATGTFVASLLIIGTVGRTFFPESDQGSIDFLAELPVGSSVEQTNKIARQIEEIVEQVSEVDTCLVTVGQAAGGRAIFGGDSGIRQASFHLDLVDRKERTRSSQQITNWLREQFADLPGVETRFMEQMGPGGVDLEIKISGDELDTLSRLGTEVMALVEDIPGLVDLELDWVPGAPEYEIRIDREKAGRAGLNATEIGHTLQTMIRGTQELTKFREGGQEYDITVRAREADRQWAGAIGDIELMGRDDELIPLREVASIVPTVGPTQISRDDRQRSVTIGGSRALGPDERALDVIAEDIEERLEDYEFPPGYDYSVGGSYEDMREAFGGIFIALGLGILLIYMILAAQFESFFHPFTIMLAIPLELIGVAIGLLVTGTPVSLFVMLGILLLTGIVVSNSILLVQMINLLRERGYELYEAIREGGAIRLRPILMTALSTLLALVPVSLGLREGSELWQPLAIAVVGGLFTSTFLTLFVVPVAYSLNEQAANWLRRLVGVA